MPNKVYVAPETEIFFADSAQTPTANCTLSALANGAGRVSAQYDQGTGSKPGWWKWVAKFQATSTVTVGNLVELYLFLSDGTRVDGNVGTADAAFLTDKRRNAKLMGFVAADVTTADTDLIASGRVFIPSRYFSVGAWNALGVALRTNTSVHMIRMTPVPDEIQ